MSVPQPPKGLDEQDKSALDDRSHEPLPEYSVKPGAKPEQEQLNVTFTGGIRAPSPNPSLISIEDLNNLDRNILPVPHGRRHASSSPAPPRTLRSKGQLFWATNKGLALVLISQLFGTLMNVTTRLLEVEGNNGQGYHPFQILFARMSITVVCASTYMWYNKTEHFPFGMKEVRLLLVARGLSGFFGVFGMYYSLLYLPLSDATVITFLAPSLACWACSYLINEPFTRMEQIGAYISLFGVVLIARPTSLFAGSSHSAPPASGDADFAPIGVNTTIETPHRLANDYDSVTPTQHAWAVGIAMLGVFGAAGAYTTLRWIGKRAHPLISVNYFAIWCTIVSVVMMLALPDVGFLIPSGVKDWCYLLLLGICGFVMQFLLAAGLQYEKSSRATNMVYTQMLFALAGDKLVFGTSPGLLSILGSSLILGSAIYVAVHKEDGRKATTRDGEVSARDEERGLISPNLRAETEVDGDMELQLRTFRV